MNFMMSIIFRAIPLLMGALCITYGLYIHSKPGGANTFIAGHVVFFLAAICIALFSTAASIIRQLIHQYSTDYKIGLPVLGYAAGGLTILAGLFINTSGSDAPSFVAGHVVTGIGLIACCVATVATASSKFIMIPVNNSGAADARPPNGFQQGTIRALYAIPVLCTLIAFVWGLDILSSNADTPHMVAGHVMTGLSLVCASLIGLVASIVRQIQNTYTVLDKILWPCHVVAMGTINVLWGLYVLFASNDPARIAPGFVLIGLGIVCYSILSKVLLLALIWRNSFPLANRIPLIPVITALLCLFIAAFLFEAGLNNEAYFVPARVLVGLGGICFTLFSIVSILESGTSGKG